MCVGHLYRPWQAVSSVIVVLFSIRLLLKSSVLVMSGFIEIAGRMSVSANFITRVAFEGPPLHHVCTLNRAGHPYKRKACSSSNISLASRNCWDSRIPFRVNAVQSYKSRHPSVVAKCVAKVVWPVHSS